MKSLKSAPKFLKNNRGMLTLDFIFASLLMFAFCAILFAFSITFTAVNIAQYSTFASARAYFAAHKNEDEQQKQGQNKFQQLIRNADAPLGNYFKNGWFELGDIKLSDFSSEYSEQPDSETFVGARVSFIAKILNMKIPLLGSTADDDLSANISSYLMREPTEEECKDFVDQRFNKIQTLKSGFSNGFVQPTQYLSMMDDGC